MNESPTVSNPLSLKSARLTPERAQAWAAAAGTGVAGTRLMALDSALMQDLLRFDRVGGPGPGLEALEVLAASLRHSRSLSVVLDHDGSEIVLTVWPMHKRVHCPLLAHGLRRLRLSRLRVVRVEPARRDAPVDDAAPAHTFALGPLLWMLALQGSRSALLPEIAGPVGYRIAPVAELNGLRALEQGPTLAAALARLGRETSALAEIQNWPGFDSERAQRLLNGLYLNAALMVSRTHPTAPPDPTRPARAPARGCAPSPARGGGLG